MSNYYSQLDFSVAKISRSDEEIRCRASLQSLRTLERKCPLRINCFRSSERFRASGERAQVLAANCADYHFFLGILLDVDFSLRKSHHGRISYTLAFSWQVSSPSVVGIRPTASPCVAVDFSRPLDQKMHRQQSMHRHECLHLVALVVKNKAPFVFGVDFQGVG